MQVAQEKCTLFPEGGTLEDLEGGRLRLLNDGRKFCI